MSTKQTLPEAVADMLQAPPRVRLGLLEPYLQAHRDQADAVALALWYRDFDRERALNECQSAVERMSCLLDDATRPPWLVAGVIAVDGRCLVAIGTSRQCVTVDSEFEGPPLQTGDVVAVTHDTNMIVERLEGYQSANRAAPVHEWHEGRLLVEIAPHQYLPLDPTPALMDANVQPGDTVTYHDQWQIAFEVVLRNGDVPEESFERVAWSQIAGLDNQIDELTFALGVKLRHPDLTKSLKLQEISGAILAGPSGTGKTTIGKGLATWAEKEFNQRVVFRTIPPGRWRDPFYGVSEQRIVEPIRSAQRLISEDKADFVILFYDEIDTLGSRSGDVTNHVDSRVMTAFLAELDGVQRRDRIFVCGATNRIELVDEALLRPGASVTWSSRFRVPTARRLAPFFNAI